MEESRTLVLIETMRSPTIGSPDKTENGLTAPRNTDLGERPHPIFPHARATRRDHETQKYVETSARSSTTTNHTEVLRLAGRPDGRQQ